MIWRFAGVLAFVVLTGGALVLANDDEEPPELPRDVRSAGALVDSIGVNVHLGFADTAYARQAEVLSLMRTLGVRHFRDAAAHSNPVLLNGLRAVAQQDLRGTLIADPSGDPATQVDTSLVAMGPDVEAFEGPNEMDRSGGPGWAAQLSEFMPRYAAAVANRAPNVDLIGPSFIDSSSRTEVAGELAGFYNAHPYAGGDPPEPALAAALRDRDATNRSRPEVFTEAGYHNALAAPAYHRPVSDPAVAVYLPRLLVTAFGAGVRRTFLYELIDSKPEPGLADPEQHFGLVRSDLSPKPAFGAVQSLIAAVRSSPGAPASPLPSWKLEMPDGADIEHLALRRRDGSRIMALWRPVSVWDAEARQAIDPGRIPVEITLDDREARDIEVWRPSLSQQPVQRMARSSRVGLELAGDLVLVSFR